MSHELRSLPNEILVKTGIVSRLIYTDDIYSTMPKLAPVFMQIHTEPCVLHILVTVQCRNIPEGGSGFIATKLKTLFNFFAQTSTALYNMMIWYALPDTFLLRIIIINIASSVLHKLKFS